MKSGNLYRIVIGAVMIFSALLTLVITGGEAITGTLLLCTGLAFLITGIVRHRRFGADPEADERSRKIGAYGLSYAWLTGLFFIWGLFLLDYLNILTLGTRNALAISLVVLALSAVLFQAYLFRKGDID